MTAIMASTALLPAFERALLILTVTATIVYASAALICGVRHRASAAFRHTVWRLSALTVLLSPILLPPLQSVIPRSVASLGQLPDALSSPAHSSQVPVLPSSASEINVPMPPRTEGASASHQSAAPAISPPRAESVWTVHVPWRSVLIVAWLGGVSFQLIVLAASLLRLQRVLRRCRPTRNETALTFARRIQSALGLPPRTALLDSEETAIPFVVGLLRPRIVLPSEISNWSAERLRAVLTHELIHVRRRDIAWQKIARLTAALAWFHPLAWIALRRLRIEAEFATDDAVLGAGEHPVDYAEHLLSILRDARRSRRLLPAVVSMAGRSPAERRIRAILDPATNRCPPTRRQRWIIVASCLVATAGAALCAPMASQETSPSPAEKEDHNLPTTGRSSHRQAVAGTSDHQILEDLEKTTTVEVSAEETLLEVVQKIAWKHKVPIRLDELSFRRLGISSHDCPGALSLVDVSLHSCLKKPVEAFSDRVPSPIAFGLKVKDGLLQIVAAEDAYQQFFEGEESENPLTAIHGTVQTQNGRPAAYARIELRNLAGSTFVLADEHGRFHVPVRLRHRNGLLLAEDDSNGADVRIVPYLEADNKFPSLSLTLEPRARVEVLVTDSQRAPVADAQVSIASASRRYLSRKTGEDGRLVIELPRRLPVDLVVAWKDGKGLDYRVYREYLESQRTDRGTVSMLPARWTFALEGAGTVRVAVKDELGRPVTGLKVYPNGVQRVDQGDELWLSEVADFSQTTDAAGEVAFRWIPTWHRGPLWFFQQSPKFASRMITVNPPGKGEQSTEVEVVRRVRISGRVRTPDGRPVPGARVVGTSAGWVSSFGDNSLAFADHEGAYSIALAPDHVGVLVAFSPDRRLISPAKDDIDTSLRADQGNVDLVVHPARRISGRIVRPSGLSGQASISLRQHGREISEIPGITLPNPQSLTSQVRPHLAHLPATRGEDEFEFFVGPGRFTLQTWPEATSPQLGRSGMFEIEDQAVFRFDVEFHEPNEAVLEGKVVSGDPDANPAEARIFARDLGTKNFHRKGTADKGGTFRISRIRQPTLVLAYSADRTFGGTRIVDANEDSAVVTLSPTANVNFRLVDGDGRPVRDKVMLRADMTPFHNGRKGLWISDINVVPDASGRVRLTGLILNMPYRLTIADEGNQNIRTLKETSYAEPGEFDLGDLKIN